VTEPHSSLVEGNFDADQDRYPTLTEVLSRILDDSDLVALSVERVEVSLHASGEATYRVWEPRAEEPLGGYYAAL
jgi:hypothetical protein